MDFPIYTNHCGEPPGWWKPPLENWVLHPVILLRLRFTFHQPGWLPQLSTFPICGSPNITTQIYDNCIIVLDYIVKQKLRIMDWSTIKLPTGICICIYRYRCMMYLCKWKHTACKHMLDDWIRTSTPWISTQKPTALLLKLCEQCLHMLIVLCNDTGHHWQCHFSMPVYT